MISVAQAYSMSCFSFMIGFATAVGTLYLLMTWAARPQNKGPK